MREPERGGRERGKEIWADRVLSVPPPCQCVCVCGSACDSLMSSSTLYAAMFAGRRACFYQVFSSLNAEKVCDTVRGTEAGAGPTLARFGMCFCFLFGLVRSR